MTLDRRRAPVRLAVVVLAVGVSGCASRATPVPSSPARPLAPARGTVILRRPPAALRRQGAALGLTTVLPRTVRRACATAAAKSRVAVRCPSLVPTGPAIVVGVDGVRRSRDFRPGFVMNVLSRSVAPSASSPGHWSIAQGEGRALARLLHPPGFDARHGPVKPDRLRVGQTPVTVWEMPSFRVFHGVYGGHVVVTWRCAGRDHQVSMHGHANRARAILIAASLIAGSPPACRR